MGEELMEEVQEVSEPETETEPSPDISEETYREPEVNVEMYQEAPDSADAYQEFPDDSWQFSGDIGEPVEPDLLERIDTLLDAIEEENGIQTASEIMQPSVPIEGYRDWNYGIVIYFEVYPYGAGYWMNTSQNLSEPEDLEAWYSRMTSLVGDTIKDFHILTVTDDDGKEVYNRGTYTDPGDEPGGDNPVHDGSGEYLEMLEAIHSELEAIKDADKENYLLMADRYEEMFNMQAVETGSSIIICVALFIIVAELAFREIFARLK